MNDTTVWCQNASVTEPQREDAPQAVQGGARATVDCAIGMERVLGFRAAFSFRHAPRATSLSEGGSIAPHCAARTFFSRAFKERPYKRAALCGYKISKKTIFRDHFGSWVPK